MVRLLLEHIMPIDVHDFGFIFVSLPYLIGFKCFQINLRRLDILRDDIDLLPLKAPLRESDTPIVVSQCVFWSCFPMGQVPGCLNSPACQLCPFSCVQAVPSGRRATRSWMSRTVSLTGNGMALSLG